MTNISEQIYIEKIKQSPEKIQKFISRIFLDNNFFIFLKRHKVIEQDEEYIADLLRSETLSYVLKTSAFEKFIENIVEILNPKPEDAEELIADFFSICIPQEIQDILEKKELNSINNSQGEKIADSEHISHHSLLSEIENPTPSISTTTDFQNQAIKTNLTAASEDSANQTAAQIKKPILTSSNPSLHSSDPSVVAYTNPALHIASKLDQNLATPSASVPKDIYISKKPDPYHEPVEI